MDFTYLAKLFIAAGILLVGVALAAILLVPLGVDILGRLFGRDARLGFVSHIRLR